MIKKTQTFLANSRTKKVCINTAAMVTCTAACERIVCLVCLVCLLQAPLYHAICYSNTSKTTISPSLGVIAVGILDLVLRAWWASGLLLGLLRAGNMNKKECLNECMHCVLFICSRETETIYSRKTGRQVERYIQEQVKKAKRKDTDDSTSFFFIAQEMSNTPGQCLGRHRSWSSCRNCCHCLGDGRASERGQLICLLNSVCRTLKRTVHSHGADRFLGACCPVCVFMCMWKYSCVCTTFCP